MATNFLQLINRLRDRFNEPRLNEVTFLTAVGFDRVTINAINYAYHEILNAEMEWPFLHAFGIIKTIPGIQLYNLTSAQFFHDSSPLTDAVRYNAGFKYDTGVKFNDALQTGVINVSQIKEVDWDGFFIYNNDNLVVIANEVHVIPSVSPYLISVTNVINWTNNLGVLYQATNQALTPVTGSPLEGEYTITNLSQQFGAYVFNAADAGKSVLISYTTAIQNTGNPRPISAIDLTYIDYDQWRQRYLVTDLNSLPQNYTKPNFVFKPQQMSQAGFSPVPDVVYNVGFECWVDVDDMVLPTDQPVIPERFWQVIIDGASKYCYEFREDPALAASVEKRFQQGIYRMRIELINRQSTMNAGFYWYPRGVSYSVVTPI